MSDSQQQHRLLRNSIRLGVLLLVALVGVAFFSGFRAGLAAYLCRAASLALDSGDDQRAAQLLREARSWSPHHYEATTLLARRALSLGDTADALTLYGELYQQGDPSEETLFALGRLQLETGDRVAATAYFAELRRLRPGSSAALVGTLQAESDSEAAKAASARLQRGPAYAQPEAPLRGVSLFHLEDHYGVSGYGSTQATAALLQAYEVGANTVSVRVPGRQESVKATTIRFNQEPPGGETDAAVVRTIRDAHALGFHVVLKPHIMLTQITDEEWRGSIGFANQQALDAWWQQYRAFILHYAKLANRERVEAFVVGVELRTMVRECAPQWRQLIADVRRVYTGKLTYAANWYHEYEEVDFWSDLDWIGIQFFFPIQPRPGPDAAIRSELRPILARLEEMAALFDRPVVFTEVGYKSAEGALEKPWEWASAQDREDLQVQAQAYDALLTATHDMPSLRGLIWWNWLCDPAPDSKFRCDFTPQGKPALEVLRKHWRRN